jgi:hypothetical protein
MYSGDTLRLECLLSLAAKTEETCETRENLLEPQASKLLETSYGSK